MYPQAYLCRLKCWNDFQIARVHRRGRTAQEKICLFNTTIAEVNWIYTIFNGDAELNMIWRFALFLARGVSRTVKPEGVESAGAGDDILHKSNSKDRRVMGVRFSPTNFV